MCGGNWQSQQTRICVLFVFDLDGECKFIKILNISVIKEIVDLAATFVG